jgi:hypothetical protein
LDVFKKAQAAGKAVVVGGVELDLDAIKVLHRELIPAKTVYAPDIKTMEEFEAIAAWLENNS